MLFRQFDDRKSGRSPGDVSGAYQMVVPQLRHLPRISARKSVEGINWYRHTVVGLPNMKGDNIYTLFNEEMFHDFIKMAADIWKADKTREFTAPAMGAMYATHEKDPKDAEAFWDAVAHEGNGHDTNHPTVALDVYLQEARKADNRTPPKPIDIYRTCIMAWNAYRRGRTIDKWVSRKSNPELE
jgi:hypothetical protein